MCEPKGGLCWSWTRLGMLGLLMILSAAPAPAEEVAAARPGEVKKDYRWGVGWDEGLALRARFANGWGVGLRVNPDLVDPDSTTASSSDGSSEWPCTGPRACSSQSQSSSKSNATGDQHTFSTALMLYHERRVGKWLAIGPYLAANYERRRDTTTETTTSHSQWGYEYPYLYVQPSLQQQEGTTTITTRRWQRTFGIELGLRPTFQFHDRFVLETRFGLELAFTKWNESWKQHSESKGGGGVTLARAEAPPLDSTSVALQPAEQNSTTEDKGNTRRLHTVGERLGPGVDLRFVVLF
jgi:hypothetical protein